jgi:hypothetical protein
VKLKSHGRNFRAKAWNTADRAAEFEPGSHVDLAFCIEDDAYSAARGYAPWQIIVKDVAAATLKKSLTG